MYLISASFLSSSCGRMAALLDIPIILSRRYFLWHDASLKIPQITLVMQLESSLPPPDSHSTAKWFTSLMSWMDATPLISHRYGDRVGGGGLRPNALIRCLCSQREEGRRRGEGGEREDWARWDKEMEKGQGERKMEGGGKERARDLQTVGKSNEP